MEKIRCRSYWEVGDGSIKIEKVLWHYGATYRTYKTGQSIKSILEHRARRETFLVNIPEEVKECYKNVTFESEGNNLIWMGSSSGKFSSKSYLKSFSSEQARKKWGENIWHKWIPERISLFGWRLIHKGLPLDDNVRKLGISMVSRCQCCKSEEETLEHLFFKGVWASKIWYFLSKLLECSWPNSLSECIEKWLNKVGRRDVVTNLRIGLALHGLWYIWQRNENWHGGKAQIQLSNFTRWTREMLGQMHKHRTDSAACHRIFMTLGIPFDYESNIRGRWCSWKPHENGNTMDFYVSEDHNTGAMLCRDYRGEIPDRCFM